MDTHESIKHIEQLLEHKPGVVSHVLKLYGITEDPTPETLTQAYKTHGDMFAYNLEKLIGVDQYVGEEDPESPVIPKTGWSQFLIDGLAILGSTAQIVNAFKEKDTDTPNPQPTPNIYGLPKPLFIGLSVVTGLLVLFFIIKAIKN